MQTLYRYIPRRSNLFFALAAFMVFSSHHPLFAEAFTVIVVKSAELKPYQDVLRGFRDGCGCDVREVSLQAGEGEEALLENSPDAIVAIGTTVFKKIKTIRNAPVIYTMVIPSETDHLEFPNMSGVSMDIAPGTYVASLREVFPAARKIGLLYDPKNTAAFVDEAAKAAAAAGFDLVAKEVRDPAHVTALLEKLSGKIDVFWMLPDPTVVSAGTIDSLLRFSFQNNVPVFSFSKKYVELGAIAALDLDPYDIGAQAAAIARRLAAGQQGAIREYARASRLSINEKVAKKMGLRIRDDVLSKVKKVE